MIIVMYLSFLKIFMRQKAAISSTGASLCIKRNTKVVGMLQTDNFKVLLRMRGV